MIRLPIPPSVNALYRNVKGVGRVKSGVYKAWLNEAGWKLKTQRVDTVIGPYVLTIRLPAKMQGDIDNRVKAISDLLVLHKIIPDDRLAQGINVSRAPVTEVEVEIAPHG